MRFDAQLLQNFAILGCFEAPILRVLVPIVVKKMKSENKYKKSEKKGARVARGKMSGGGPL